MFPFLLFFFFFLKSNLVLYWHRGKSIYNKAWKLREKSLRKIIISHRLGIQNKTFVYNWIFLPLEPPFFSFGWKWNLANFSEISRHFPSFSSLSKHSVDFGFLSFCFLLCFSLRVSLLGLGVILRSVTLTSNVRFPVVFGSAECTAESFHSAFQAPDPANTSGLLLWYYEGNSWFSSSSHWKAQTCMVAPMHVPALLVLLALPSFWILLRAKLLSASELTWGFFCFIPHPHRLGSKCR